MVGYPIGKVLSVSGGLLADLMIFLIPGLFLVDGLDLGVDAWLGLAWVVVIGMVATLPIGAILGPVFTSARSPGLVQLPVLGMIAISGIFCPVTALPEWLQWIAQVFPVYWLGQGLFRAREAERCPVLGPTRPRRERNRGAG